MDRNGVISNARSSNGWPSNGRTSTRKTKRDSLISMSPKLANVPRYIITDPCYIMHRDDYDNLGAQTAWEMTIYEPLTCRYRANSKQAITIFTIESTPHGDGSYMYRGFDIGVDAGILCIAYNPNGWAKESLGAKFITMAEAKKAFPTILRHF
jgi:hypothetical protein